MRLKKAVDFKSASDEFLLPDKDLTGGSAGLWSGKLFNDIERHARHSNQKNGRDPISHASAKPNVRELTS
ncbi:MAG TPA: hypothetical protein VNX27_06495 [Chthoniobacterales bacterium]|nr:hypothetical protein [Chthoniobacterales bacterium]